MRTNRGVKVGILDKIVRIYNREGRTEMGVKTIAVGMLILFLSVITVSAQEFARLHQGSSGL